MMVQNPPYWMAKELVSYTEAYLVVFDILVETNKICTNVGFIE